MVYHKSLPDKKKVVSRSVCRSPNSAPCLLPPPPSPVPFCQYIPQVNLVDGQMFRFDMDDEPGDSARVKLPHKEIIDTLREVTT